MLIEMSGWNFGSHHADRFIFTRWISESEEKLLFSLFILPSVKAPRYLSFLL